MKRALLKTKEWFYFFCVLQLAVWTLIPTFFRHNVPFDTIEGIVWGNQWQLGYDKHPPLAPWLSSMATHFGGAVGWPVYLLGQIAVITTFLAVWQLAKKLLPKDHAVVSVLLLFGVLYYSSPSIIIKFNPTTLMSPIWALSILAFYNAITSKTIKNWLLLGFLAALSILTKYESLVLIFCMLVTMLTTREGRASFKTIGPYLAIVICFGVLFPHLFWAIKNDLPGITYADVSLHLNKTPAALKHIFYPLNFFISQVLACLPMLFLVVPFLRKNLINKEEIKQSRFSRMFLLIMGLGPLAFTVILSLVTGCHLYAKWATPFFSLNGILLISFLRPAINKKIWRQFIVFLMALFIGLILVRGSYIYLGTKFNLRFIHIPDAFFSGKDIAQELTQKWHDKYHGNLYYVAGDRYLSAHISVYSKDRPVPYFDWNKKESSWIEERDINKRGAIFVWRADRFSKEYITAQHQELKNRFPNLGNLNYQSFYQSDKNLPPIIIAFALLPPKENIKNR